jgi:RNA polymerase sigma factor (sigma-70 family)
MEVSALPHPASMPGLRGPSALLRLQSDERLIALTRRGQPAAFETLCARYQSRLLSFCRHMLSSREDAEDVLQEVFAAAFNAVLADEREINVRPWLYRIARNRSLNHLRRTAAIGVDSMDVHFAEGGISTGDKVLRRESFRELIADVHELPETQRTALLLREIDALSYDQIAQAMETTIPSVKSLLVRARISLAEAAEARKLSCDEVRLELGEVAEGLAKLSTPARRHVRGCDRCLFFKKQLRENNRALAAILPVAPLLLLKKLILTKLGSTASAGGAHAAGAGATVGATATATATVGAGAAAGGGSLAGGLMTAGAGALATKAVAGLAAAAIVTAGAVAADHAVVPSHRHHAPLARATASVPMVHYSGAPVIVREHAQPSTPGPSVLHRTSTAALAPRHARHAVKAKAKLAAPVVAATAPVLPQAAVPVTTTSPAAPPVPGTTAAPGEPQGVQVTEVTSETTQLPSAATTSPPTTPPPVSTVPSSPTATVPPSTPLPTTPAPNAETPAAPAPAAQPSAPSAPAVVAVPVVTKSPAAIVIPKHRPDTGGTAAPAAAEHLHLGVWNGRRTSRR